MVVNPLIHSMAHLISLHEKSDTQMIDLTHIQTGFDLIHDDIKASETLKVAVKTTNSMGITPVQIAEYSVRYVQSIPVAHVTNHKCLSDGLRAYVSHYHAVSPFFRENLSIECLDNKTVIRCWAKDSLIDLYIEAFALQTLFTVALTDYDVTISTKGPHDISKEAKEMAIDLGIKWDNHQISKSFFEASFEYNSMNQTNEHYKPEVIKALSELTQSIVFQSTNISYQIKRTLLKADKPNNIKLTDFANSLNIHERTLKRKLQNEQMSYKVIQRQVIYSRIILGIHNAKNLDEFSEDLGYSDRSGLAHFIKDVSGMTLSDFLQNIGHKFAINVRRDVRVIFNNLKPIPDTIAQAVEEADNPDFNIDEFVRLIEADLGASTNLLRTATSAHFGYNCETIKSAVVLLGSEMTSNLLLSNALMNSLIELGSCYLEVDSVLSMPSRLLTAQKNIQLENSLGPITTFLPATLFIVYRSSLINELKLNPGNDSYLEHVSKFHKTSSTSTSTSELLKIQILLSNFPVIITKNLTNKINELEFDEHLMDYLIQLALFEEQGKDAEYDQLVGYILDKRYKN